MILSLYIIDINLFFLHRPTLVRIFNLVVQISNWVLYIFVKKGKLIERILFQDLSMILKIYSESIQSSYFIT
jgi:hypothetical protein